MSGTQWGHAVSDKRRHLIQYHRGGEDKARRACQTERILRASDVPPDSHESDLAFCATCLRLRRRLYTQIPETRTGWVAGGPRGQQDLDEWMPPLTRGRARD